MNEVEQDLESLAGTLRGLTAKYERNTASYAVLIRLAGTFSSRPLTSARTSEMLMAACFLSVLGGGELAAKDAALIAQLAEGAAETGELARTVVV
jgi:hypothetical protein